MCARLPAYKTSICSLTSSYYPPWAFPTAVISPLLPTRPLHAALPMMPVVRSLLHVPVCLVSLTCDAFTSVCRAPGFQSSIAQCLQSSCDAADASAGLAFGQTECGGQSRFPFTERARTVSLTRFALVAASVSFTAVVSGATGAATAATGVTSAAASAAVGAATNAATSVLPSGTGARYRCMSVSHAFMSLNYVCLLHPGLFSSVALASSSIIHASSAQASYGAASQTSSASASSSTPIGAIVGGVVGGLLLLGAVLVGCLMMRRRAARRNVMNNNGMQQSEQQPSTLQTAQRNDYTGHPTFNQQQQQPNPAWGGQTAAGYYPTSQMSSYPSSQMASYPSSAVAGGGGGGGYPQQAFSPPGTAQDMMSVSPPTSNAHAPLAAPLFAAHGRDPTASSSSGSGPPAAAPAPTAASAAPSSPWANTEKSSLAQQHAASTAAPSHVEQEHEHENVGPIGEDAPPAYV